MCVWCVSCSLVFGCPQLFLSLLLLPHPLSVVTQRHHLVCIVVIVITTHVRKTIPLNSLKEIVLSLYMTSMEDKQLHCNLVFSFILVAHFLQGSCFFLEEELPCCMKESSSNQVAGRATNYTTQSSKHNGIKSTGKVKLYNLVTILATNFNSYCIVELNA